MGKYWKVLKFRIPSVLLHLLELEMLVFQVDFWVAHVQNVSLCYEFMPRGFHSQPCGRVNRALHCRSPCIQGSGGLDGA